MAGLVYSCTCVKILWREHRLDPTWLWCRKPYRWDSTGADPTHPHHTNARLDIRVSRGPQSGRWHHTPPSWAATQSCPQLPREHCCDRAAHREGRTSWCWAACWRKRTTRTTTSHVYSVDSGFSHGPLTHKNADFGRYTPSCMPPQTFEHWAALKNRGPPVGAKVNWLTVLHRLTGSHW